ncbi:hypothetical protein AcW1_009263 [Taiwanofungus camphoratus]|nr:hypothetical protein AcW1_009263 [Antrodia cinnamomea]
MTGNIWPPRPSVEESELDKALRLEEEREAKRVSDEIDRIIEHDRLELRKKRSATKILILGQAESGKSTMLKNFQFHFAPKAFQAESEAWRAVIHLNLVCSVNFILNLLSKCCDNELGKTTSPTQRKPVDSHRWLKMRLAPLRQVEVILNKCLEVNASPCSKCTDKEGARNNGRLPEVSVRYGSGWRVLVRQEGERPPSRLWDDLDDARRILEACREDILSLWADDSVQGLLKEEEITLQDQPGFFLDQADRIASLSYTPTPEDILRARIRTVGVEEHRLIMETQIERKQEWIFYDVGGHRGQRAAWVPFFEDVNAIIFLCPMAAFNQVLSEDTSVNRLIDSLKLWKTICQSKLLANATFILLLNKCDILKTKLESGILFSHYVEQYQDQPNDVEDVINYLKRVFLAIYKDHCLSKRKLTVHATCAVDMHMMSLVLNSVRDVILLNTLQNTNLI